VYGGNNYMISYGSGTGTTYDLRWRTDGIVFENSNVTMRDVVDGSSNTVFISESVRSTGSDVTLPAGTAPQFPYQKTLNGSSGVSAGLNPQRGLLATGGGWTSYVDSNGMIVNPDLSVLVQTFTNWRGASSNALRGRGISWAHSGAFSTLTNGYTTPNSRIPDIATHFTGFLAPRSYHTGGANVMFGDGSVRFIGDSIDVALHRALHSRDGAEPMGDL
jgi:prepilin-type processing-associated H-X9-DG protein